MGKKKKSSSSPARVEAPPTSPPAAGGGTAKEVTPKMLKGSLWNRLIQKGVGDKRSVRLSKLRKKVVAAALTNMGLETPSPSARAKIEETFEVKLKSNEKFKVDDRKVYRVDAACSSEESERKDEEKKKKKKKKKDASDKRKADRGTPAGQPEGEEKVAIKRPKFEGKTNTSKAETGKADQRTAGTTKIATEASAQQPTRTKSDVKAAARKETTVRKERNKQAKASNSHTDSGKAAQTSINGDEPAGSAKLKKAFYRSVDPNTKWGVFRHSVSEEEAATVEAAMLSFAKGVGHEYTSEEGWGWLFKDVRKQKGGWNKAWPLIAESLPRRTPDQIYQFAKKRFRNPNSKGKAWTPEDINILRRLVGKHGTAWAKIGPMLDRTEHQCEYKWRRLKGKVNTGQWSEEEHALLLKAVEHNLSLQQRDAFDAAAAARRWVIDDISWAAVSVVVGTRSAPQCSEHWYHTFARGAGSENWMPEHDAALVTALQDSGATEEYDVDWGSLVPDKSSADTKKQFNVLVKAVPGWITKTFEQRLDSVAENLKNA